MPCRVSASAALGLRRARLGLRDLLGPRARLQLVERGLRLRELRLGHRALRVEVAGLELDQRLAAVTCVALLDEHLRDAPAGARADVDRARLDGARPLERLAAR